MPPDEPTISLREYIEARWALIDRANDRTTMETERSIAREVAVLRTLMQEHALAHKQMHDMSQTAIDRAYIELEKQHALVQRAVDKAEATINERLQGMNEFRAALGEQSATFVRRDHLDTVLASVADRGDDRLHALNTIIDRLEAADARMENKWANLEGRMYAISAVLFVFTVIGFALRILNIGN